MIVYHGYLFIVYVVDLGSGQFEVSKEYKLGPNDLVFTFL
jgi:hypothetical protein